MTSKEVEAVRQQVVAMNAALLRLKVPDRLRGDLERAQREVENLAGKLMYAAMGDGCVGR